MRPRNSAWIEYRFSKPKVAGSNPAGDANLGLKPWRCQEKLSQNGSTNIMLALRTKRNAEDAARRPFLLLVQNVNRTSIMSALVMRLRSILLQSPESTISGKANTMETVRSTCLSATKVSLKLAFVPADTEEAYGGTAEICLRCIPKS